MTVKEDYLFTLNFNFLFTGANLLAFFWGLASTLIQWLWIMFLSRSLLVQNTKNKIKIDVLVRQWYLATPNFYIPFNIFSFFLRSISLYITTFYFKTFWFLVPISITQLAETYIIICRGRDSNLGHSLIRLEKKWILTTKLFEEKKKHFYSC